MKTIFVGLPSHRQNVHKVVEMRKAGQTLNEAMETLRKQKAQMKEVDSEVDPAASGRQGRRREICEACEYVTRRHDGGPALCSLTTCGVANRCRHPDGSRWEAAEG